MLLLRSPRSRRARRAAALAALALACTTCAPPLQSGGVIVAGGAADRLGAMCRWRGEGGAEGLCPAEQAALAPAKVRRLGKDPKDRLAGSLAIGREGDYLLENDQIAVVIDQLGPGTGFAESGGNVVDAADAQARRDELGQVFTYFGTFPRQALYERLEAGVDQDGTAWIEVRGRELYEPALAITTRYSLRPGDRGLLITTALENTGAAPIADLELGDAVQWGGAEKVAPGREPGFRGDCEAPYLAGVGEGAAYALVPVEATDLHAKNGTAWSNASYAQVAALPPGGKAAYARVLAVAQRGDALGPWTELFVLGGGAPGGLAVELTDARGAPLGAVDGRVTLTPLDAQGKPVRAEIPLWLRAVAGARDPAADPAAVSAAASGEIPPGRYQVAFEGGGRRAIAPAAIAVRAGEVARARLALTEAVPVRVLVTEVDAARAGARTRAPAKIQWYAEGSATPAERPVLSAGGPVMLSLAPGRYRFIASRGPESTIAEQVVDVQPGAVREVDLAMARVVDTTGYLGCDLHQHTALSADSGVALEARVLSNVAEGVECAVASEHNLVVDWTPAVRALGLAERLHVVPGNEITSDASRDPFGHLNVFPLAPDPAAPRGGALPVRDRAPRELIDAVRALPGDRVIQVNHPRSGRNGYFDQLGFDPAIGAGKHPGYDGRFDAVEVWSGRYVAGRSKVLEDLWGLLRAGRPATPTANTDSHAIVGSEPGYPRTYVGVGVDEPARLDPAALVEGLRRRRDVVITNGPFVTMRLGEVRQGGLASVGRGAVLAVRVERAPWVDATELTVLVGGVPAATVALTGAASTAAGAKLDEISVPVVVGRAGGGKGSGGGKGGKGPAPVVITEDTFVVAVVRGERPLTPVLVGEADEIRPFAMTAPIWIDADGDGRALGR